MDEIEKLQKQVNLLLDSMTRYYLVWTKHIVILDNETNQVSFDIEWKSEDAKQAYEEMGYSVSQLTAKIYHLQKEHAERKTR